MIHDVVLVGRGAVGTVYAAALQDTFDKGEFSDDRLRIAVDEERLQRYKNEPFFFNGEPRVFEYFTPKATSEKPVDLIILATKWGGYADALDLIEPLVGPETIILPLLNGLSAYRLAAERWGVERVMRGFFIGHTASRSDKNGAGSVTQDGSYMTTFGLDRNLPPYAPKVQQIADLFDRAKIKYKVGENMEAAQWQKFVFNLGTNQPTSLYRVSYGQMSQMPQAMALSHNLMKEAQEIAIKLGIEDAEKLIERSEQFFALLSPEDHSSMAQDTLAGRPTEVDMFAGEVVRLGAKVGVETPHNAKFIEDLKRAGL